MLTGITRSTQNVLKTGLQLITSGRHKTALLTRAQNPLAIFSGPPVFHEHSFQAQKGKGKKKEKYIIGNAIVIFGHHLHGHQ